MAITYGFFNSVNGDRLYNADDISNYFLKLISNGVFATPANAMQVQQNSGLTVSVSAGWGFINCKWLNNDSTYNLTLDAADIALNRIDRVVMRLNADNTLRNMELAIIKGTPAATPTAPTLTRVTGGVWELSLAQIYVAANATTITQANITDERPNTSVCGWVTGLIDQIDATNLFAQYNEAFNEWFTTVKETLATTTLIRQYTQHYETTQASETTIPINIAVYNYALDVLNVYVNGLKLTPGVDYTENNSANTITLAQALDVIGTPVEFEVLKSVDGSEAESVVDMVYQLQTEIAKIDRNTYYCNGVTDSTGLADFVANWLQGQNTRGIIRVVGTFGANATTQAPDGYNYSFVYSGSSQNPITFDFSDCDTILAQNANFAYFSGCTVRGLSVKYNNVAISAARVAIYAVNATLENCRVSGTVTGAYEITAFQAIGSRLERCDVNLTGANNIYGINADSTIITRSNVQVYCTGNSSAYGVTISDASRCSDSNFRAQTASTVTTGTASGGIGGGYYSNCQFLGFGGVRGQGFYLRSGYLLNAVNCIFRGYTKDTANGWGLGITGASSSANSLIMTGINCNQISVTGYSQTGTMSFTDGYGSYMGCFYAAPTIPATIVSYGSFIRNRV